MSQAGEFRRIAILGAGLIGASFAAASKKVRPDTSIVAFDRPEVLAKLRASGFPWELTPNLNQALRNAELVYIALPVAAAIQMLSEISLHCMPDALITDACSTKAEICKAAQEVLGKGISFLGGHPIAGKEVGGFKHATADLFRGKRYALANDNRDELLKDSRVRSFLDLLQAIGAEPVWIESRAHDRAMAAVSQTPQLVAIALAGVLLRGVSETSLPLSLSGTGLSDMLRTAGSPYEIWRDICATNCENIEQYLDQIGQEIQFLRQHLTRSELEIKFRDANELHRMLRDLGISSAETSPQAPGSDNRVGVNG